MIDVFVGQKQGEPTVNSVERGEGYGPRQLIGGFAGPTVAESGLWIRNRSLIFTYPEEPDMARAPRLTPVQRKNFYLRVDTLKKAQKALGARTETEAVERALELVVSQEDALLAFPRTL